MIRCKVAGFPLTISLEKGEKKVFLDALSIPVQFESRQQWKATLRNKTGEELVYSFFFPVSVRPTRNSVLSWLFSERDFVGLPEFFGESYPAVKELFAD
jgi:hypothetical protein